MKTVKNTKIICTIGPVSESAEAIYDLARAGMNVARLNFSHGDHEEQLNRIETIKRVNKEHKTKGNQHRKNKTNTKKKNK